VNPCGLTSNSRNNPLGDFDINRSCPDKTYLNTALTKIIDKADWVIDLHEGWGFHKLDRRSVGSGVYAGNTEDAKALADRLIREINKHISDPIKQFVTFEIPSVKGSLRDYCNSKSKHYILVETSGINNIQPLSTRINQQSFLISDIINNLHNK
jgi:predicted deacylase